MLGIWLLQHRARNGQMHWMLALTDSTSSDGRGAFYYADKRPGETRQLQSIRSISLHDEPTGNSKKLLIAWIEPDKFSGNQGFCQCLALASGFEEKLFIIGSVRNMETFGIVPAGKLRDCRTFMGPESPCTSSEGSPPAMSTGSGMSSSPPPKRARISDSNDRSTASSSRAGPPSGPGRAAEGSHLPGKSRRT